MEFKITKYTSSHNTTYCNRTPKYIVWHYTAGTSSKSGKALDVAKMFSTSTVQASADFIVDDELIVQYNPDPKMQYCWAVGGNKYTTLTNSGAAKLYGIATNANCVNIELCSNKKSTKTLNATDTDWYFTDQTINNAKMLTIYLMTLYGIPQENVILHNTVTGKICPNPFCINEAALKNWTAIKNELAKSRTKITGNCGLYKNDNTVDGRLQSIKAGQYIYLVNDTGHGWSYVCFSGEFGYVKNSVIDNKSLSKYPIGIAIKDVMLRSAMKVESSTNIETFKSGTKVTIIAAIGDWYEVKINGKPGFMVKKKIKVQ